MFIVYGVRQYGRIEEHQGTCIATQFAHIWFLPLFPVRSHMVLGGEGSDSKGIQIPLRWKSVLAGYLRIWGPILTVLLGLGALGSLATASASSLSWVGEFLFEGFLATVALVGAVVAWAFLGKLDREERQKRAVHALHLGYHADPANFGDARTNIRERLLEQITNYAQGLWSAGYRTATDPRSQWHYIALDPTVQHEGLITAAYSLARVEGSLAHPSQQGALTQIEWQIWQRIQQLNPPYLQQVPA